MGAQQNKIKDVPQNQTSAQCKVHGKMYAPINSGNPANKWHFTTCVHNQLQAAYQILRPQKKEVWLRFGKDPTRMDNDSQPRYQMELIPLTAAIHRIVNEPRPALTVCP